MMLPPAHTLYEKRETVSGGDVQHFDELLVSQRAGVNCRAGSGNNSPELRGNGVRDAVVDHWAGPGGDTVYADHDVDRFQGLGVLRRAPGAIVFRTRQNRGDQR